MQGNGPPIESLTRRLLETPAEFLAEPKIGGRGEVVVAAVVNDLLRRHGRYADIAALRPFQQGDSAATRNRLALAAITAWLLADPWLLAAGLPHAALLQVLDGAVAELADSNPAPRFISDPDRREELARTVLARLGLRPDGETPAQAADRLASLSGTERKRLLAARRAAEERAQAIREALARKAAAESADKMSRE